MVSRLPLDALLKPLEALLALIPVPPLLMLELEPLLALLLILLLLQAPIAAPLRSSAA